MDCFKPCLYHLHREVLIVRMNHKILSQTYSQAKPTIVAGLGVFG